MSRVGVRCLLVYRVGTENVWTPCSLRLVLNCCINLSVKVDTEVKRYWGVRRHGATYAMLRYNLYPGMPAVDSILMLSNYKHDVEYYV